jgi:hypothetical protein
MKNVMQNFRYIVSLSLIISTLFYTGCIFSKRTSSVATTKTTAAPTTNTVIQPLPSFSVQGIPSILIVTPADGAVIASSDVKITILVSNFTLVSQYGIANNPRQGHIHVYKDVDAPTTPFQPAFTTKGTYADDTALTYVWPNVGTGVHTFTVQLVNNDHSPVIPLETAKITINVQLSTSK